MTASPVSADYNGPQESDHPLEKEREHGKIDIEKTGGADTMAYKHYTPDFKAKIVLQVLQGEKELGEIASENSLNPNMVRNWKTEFLSKASSIFENKDKAEKEAKRKEEVLEKKNQQMLKTIGQLTLERDFLQDCFRQQGHPVPRLDPEGV